MNNDSLNFFLIIGIGFTAIFLVLCIIYLFKILKKRKDNTTASGMHIFLSLMGTIFLGLILFLLFCGLVLSFVCG